MTFYTCFLFMIDLNGLIVRNFGCEWRRIFTYVLDIKWINNKINNQAKKRDASARKRLIERDIYSPIPLEISTNLSSQRNSIELCYVRGAVTFPPTKGQFQDKSLTEGDKRESRNMPKRKARRFQDSCSKLDCWYAQQEDSKD